MKTPIEPKDIRKGDLIRTEAAKGGVIVANLTASEWRADGSEHASDFGSSRLYLLDRPEPAFDAAGDPR